MKNFPIIMRLKSFQKQETAKQAIALKICHLNHPIKMGIPLFPYKTKTKLLHWKNKL